MHINKLVLETKCQICVVHEKWLPIGLRTKYLFEAQIIYYIVQLRISKLEQRALSVKAIKSYIE